MACFSEGDEILQNARQILLRALPDFCVHSLETLEGGATNSNVLVRFETFNDLFVLRQYLRGTQVCQKEVDLLQALQELIPVPRLVKSDATGSEIGTPYLIYRFLPGFTFRQIRANGSQRDKANAAHAVGRCLGVLQNQDISLFGACRFDPRFQFTEQQLSDPVLQGCIGTADLLLLQQLLAEWSQVLGRIANEQALVHGDFNHGNVLLRSEGDRWVVAGILDWEFACIGSPLWDAARFMCYEKPDCVQWESHFIDGFRAESGGLFPDDWEALSRVMNTLSAAASLASGAVQERFISDLTRLIHHGLRGERVR